MTMNSIEDRLAKLERIVPQAETMAKGIAALVDCANAAMERSSVDVTRLDRMDERIKTVEQAYSNLHRDVGAKVNGNAFGAYAVGVNETLNAIERKASDTAQKADRCFIELYKAVGKLSEALDVKLDEGADMVQDVQGNAAPATPPEQWIILYGNAMDGHTIVGPFSCSQDAVNYASTDDERSWHVAMLQAPAR